jgi:hypothetical protein
MQMQMQWTCSVRTPVRDALSRCKETWISTPSPPRTRGASASRRFESLGPCAGEAWPVLSPTKGGDDGSFRAMSRDDGCVVLAAEILT